LKSSECYVDQVGEKFVGHATISRVSSSEGTDNPHQTRHSPLFATELKAMGYARNFAEMWCDENLLDGHT
jgi:hypothetical protein